MENRQLHANLPYRPLNADAGKGNPMLSIHRLLRHCMDLIDACDLLQNQCCRYLELKNEHALESVVDIDQFGVVVVNYKEFIRAYEQAIFRFVANSRNAGAAIVAQFHQEKFMELYLLLQKKYVTMLKLYELVVVSRHRPGRAEDLLQAAPAD